MSSGQEQRPKVGVGVMVIKDGKVFMQLRKGAHGADTWSFPGGHLEWFETVEECAKREVREETGLEVENARFLAITNDFHRNENRHYITIYVAADYANGEVKMNEEETQGHGWFFLDELPQPLFLPVQNLIAGNCMPNDWRSKLFIS